MNKVIKIITIISIVLIAIILFSNSKVEANNGTILWIDNITNNREQDNTLNISGWVMSEDKNATIKVSIQNTNITKTDFTRFGREDVLQSITSCGGRNTNSNPGYTGKIDISNLADGTYNLVIQAISGDNTVLAEEIKTIKVRNIFYSNMDRYTI